SASCCSRIRSPRSKASCFLTSSRSDSAKQPQVSGNLLFKALTFHRLVAKPGERRTTARKYSCHDVRHDLGPIVAVREQDDGSSAAGRPHCEAVRALVPAPVEQRVRRVFQAPTQAPRDIRLATRRILRIEILVSLARNVYPGLKPELGGRWRKPTSRQRRLQESRVV